MKKYLSIPIIFFIISISVYAKDKTETFPLKQGDWVTLKDCGQVYEISTIEGNKIPLSYKITEISKEFLVLQGISAVETVYLPFNSIKVVKVTKL